ncbi:unnamed protein product [Porites evermanni]|uniref:VWFA domain-containing protein n=1 Tax=Porites evermanni TaxID=104178 RepID=A0ABN8MZ55_9CNID|nr:unnamed protein product [Porites evermanni]
MTYKPLKDSGRSSKMTSSCKWLILPSTASRITGMSKPKEILKTCKVSADVAFIVDSSGSIGRRKWPLVLDFLKKVISEFNVGPDGTHVAVVAYSTNPKLEFSFNVVSGDQITAEEYGKRIDRIRFQRGFTYIDKALKLANEQVFVTSAGMRPDVPKVYMPTFASIAIVITDGAQTTTGGYTPLNEASQGIKDKGVAVYSLGIGKNVDLVQLRQIASSDSNVFRSAGFDELVEVVRPIVQESCPKPTPPPTPDSLLYCLLILANCFRGCKNKHEWSDIPVGSSQLLFAGNIFNYMYRILYKSSFYSPGAICPIPMDTTFIIDSSLCDSDSDWNRLLYFIQALVTHFNVSPSGGRIALIPFSTGAKAALKFNTLKGSLLNGEEVNKRVGKLECQGGSRRIDKALDLADNEVLIPTAGMRDVSRPVLVILAGKQTTDKGAYTPLDEASYRLKSKGSPVFVLGIGKDVDTTELNQIASGPDNVLRVDSFKDLYDKAPQAKTGICIYERYPPPPPLPPTTPVPTEFVCKAVADVAFIVDSSGSIGRRNWVKMLQFLKDMVKAFNVGPQKTHIAVVAYSTIAKVEFRFNRLTGSAVSEEGYNGLIDGIRFQRGFTFIDKALKLANEQIFSTNFGMRPALPQIAIVITDGEQTTNRGPYTPLSEASKGLKDKQVILYALGIGKNVNQDQLNAIASSKNNVFTAASFSDLTPVAQTIVQNSCPAVVVLSKKEISKKGNLRPYFLFCVWAKENVNFSLNGNNYGNQNGLTEMYLNRKNDEYIRNTLIMTAIYQKKNPKPKPSDDLGYGRSAKGKHCLFQQKRKHYSTALLTIKSNSSSIPLLRMLSGNF